eukprot:gene5402-7139_t
MNELPSSCIRCGCDISNAVYIACAECHDIHLCPQCFAAGVELKGHKKTHDYYVINRGETVLFREDWKCEEELRLLKAVESSGFGNWEGVASRMTKRTADECKRHYTEVYLEVPTAPMPGAPREVPLKRIAKRKTFTQRRSRNTVDRAKQDLIPQLDTEYAGFFPCRGDYASEYFINAELSLNDVVMYDDDPEIVTSLKQALLNAYQLHLAVRNHRRSFAAEYGLNDPNEVHALSTTGKLQDYCRRLAKFARFHSSDQHKRLLRSLKRQAQLQQRIKRLQSLRKQGITSIPNDERSIFSEFLEEDKKTQAPPSTPDCKSLRKTVFHVDPKLSPKSSYVVVLTWTASQLPISMFYRLMEEMLSPLEANFCTQTEINPITYLRVKKFCLINNRLTKIPQLLQLCGVPMKDLITIQAFLTKQGWRRNDNMHHSTLPNETNGITAISQPPVSLH